MGEALLLRPSLNEDKMFLPPAVSAAEEGGRSVVDWNAHRGLWLVTANKCGVCMPICHICVTIVTMSCIHVSYHHSVIQPVLVLTLRVGHALCYVIVCKLL